MCAPPGMIDVMTTELFADDLRVHYAFAHLLTNGRDEPAELSAARRGQVNGLAGAAVAHQVHLVTGLQTGKGASGPHRARYGAWGFEAGRRTDSASHGPDRYLLQLWPAPAAPDRIVRQTSSHAASWHDTARNA